MIFVAVLRRSGANYIIDVYPHEADRYVRQERGRRCFYARTFLSRDAAKAALARAERHWNDIRLRRRMG
jgi:hypothetical protein